MVTTRNQSFLEQKAAFAAQCPYLLQSKWNWKPRCPSAAWTQAASSQQGGCKQSDTKMKLRQLCRWIRLLWARCTVHQKTGPLTSLQHSPPFSPPPPSARFITEKLTWSFHICCCLLWSKAVIPCIAIYYHSLKEWHSEGILPLSI